MSYNVKTQQKIAAQRVKVRLSLSKGQGAAFVQAIRMWSQAQKGAKVSAKLLAQEKKETRKLEKLKEKEAKMADKESKKAEKEAKMADKESKKAEKEAKKNEREVLRRAKIADKKHKLRERLGLGKKTAYSGLRVLFGEKKIEKDPKCIRQGTKPKPAALIKAEKVGANAARKKKTVTKKKEERFEEKYDEYDDNLMYMPEGFVSVYSGMLYKTIEEYDEECKGRKYFSNRKGI